MANVNPSLQQLSELIILIFISLIFLADPSGVALHDYLQTISSISAYLARCLQALLKKNARFYFLLKPVVPHAWKGRKTRRPRGSLHNEHLAGRLRGISKA